jgi:hypothetical protein
VQLWGIVNLDPDARAVGNHGSAYEDPLQAWGVHNCNALNNGHADLHTPEAMADEAEPHSLVPASLYAQFLQGGAPVEEEAHVATLDDHGADDELAEVGERRVGTAREGGRVRELPEAEVEFGERGGAEERHGEKHVERPGAVDEDQLLDALVREPPDPARELRLVRAHVAADDVDGEEGARVRSEDAGDGRDEARRVGAHGLAVAAEEPLDEVGVGEGERRESAAVRTASLAGRRETMLRRIAEGRALRRSSPEVSGPGRAERKAAALTGVSRREV